MPVDHSSYATKIVLLVTSTKSYPWNDLDNESIRWRSPSMRLDSVMDCDERYLDRLDTFVSGNAVNQTTTEERRVGQWLSKYIECVDWQVEDLHCNRALSKDSKECRGWYWETRAVSSSTDAYDRESRRWDNRSMSMHWCRYKRLTSSNGNRDVSCRHALETLRPPEKENDQNSFGHLDGW